jgi:hypothetical protein
MHGCCRWQLWHGGEADLPECDNECELPCVAIEEELAERIQLNVYLSAKTRPRFFVLFIDFCVYLQVRCLYLKSTMGKVYRVF